MLFINEDDAMRFPEWDIIYAHTGYIQNGMEGVTVCSVGKFFKLFKEKSYELNKFCV